MVTLPMFTREKAKGLMPLKTAAVPGFDIVSPVHTIGTTTTICSAAARDRQHPHPHPHPHHGHGHDQKTRTPNDRPPANSSSSKPLVACSNDHFDGNSSPFSIRSLLRSHSRASGSLELTEEFQVARSKEQEPTIPSPRVFQPSQSNDTPIGAPFLPSVTQCAIHLELLEVFWHLKKRVTVTDAASFDVIFGHQGKGARYWRERRGWGVNRVKKESEWVEAERERVWRAYVELAVERFQRWWTRLDAALSEKGKQDSVAELQSDSGSVKFFDKKDVIIRWSIEATGDPSISAGGVLDDGVMSELPPHALPPLDVLMIWYCYMLMPKTYFDNIDSPTSNILWDITFPWSSIHSAIDANNWTYNPSSKAQQYYQDLTTDEFDLIASLYRDLNLPGPYPHPQHCESCPECSEAITFPVTDSIDYSGWAEATKIFCRSCKGLFSRSQILKLSPLGCDVARAVVHNSAFWDDMHHHMWLRSPALSGKAYWGDVLATETSRERPSWLQPAGTLERAITRLREFIVSRGNVTSTSLPADVDLVWRTLALSPPALSSCHPELSGKRLINIASCKQINVDRKKAMMNAKRYGPSEWERCLCWTCEAARTEKDAGEKEALGAGAGHREKQHLVHGAAKRELEAWQKVAMKRKVRLVVEWFAENEMARREDRSLLDRESFAEELRFVDVSKNW